MISPLFGNVLSRWRLADTICMFTTNAIAAVIIYIKTWKLAGSHLFREVYYNTEFGIQAQVGQFFGRSRMTRNILRWCSVATI